MSCDLSYEDCIVIEQMYLEYCDFTQARSGVVFTRLEWANSIIELGKRTGNPDIIRDLINHFKMKKNFNLN